MPDSLFKWTFYAYSGDVWGGSLYDDSADYAVGSTIYSTNGYYSITSEYAYGYDLTATNGIYEGDVFTSWYWDAGSAQYLSTYSGGSYETGFNGLGSEYDFAWTGTLWDDFGVGGAYQSTIFG